MNNTYQQAFLISFKAALIWQNEDLDCGGYTVYDFTQESDQAIIENLHTFKNSLPVDLQVTLLNIPAGQMGHTLALESMGHGVGFFDSEDQTVHVLSDYVKQNINDVFEQDNKLFVEFIK